MPGSEEYLLRLCGKNLKRWKRRFFFLDVAHGTLFEFASQSKQTVKKMYTVAEMSNLVVDGLFIEFTSRGNRRIRIRASTLDQASAWFARLNTAISSATNQAPFPAGHPLHISRPRAGTSSPTASLLKSQQSQGRPVALSLGEYFPLFSKHATYNSNAFLAIIIMKDLGTLDTPRESVDYDKDMKSGLGDSDTDNSEYETQSSGEGDIAEDKIEAPTSKASTWTSAIRSMFIPSEHALLMGRNEALIKDSVRCFSLLCNFTRLPPRFYLVEG